MTKLIGSLAIAAGMLLVFEQPASAARGQFVSKYTGKTLDITAGKQVEAVTGRPQICLNVEQLSTGYNSRGCGFMDGTGPDEILAWAARYVPEEALKAILGALVDIRERRTLAGTMHDVLDQALIE